MVDGKIDAKSTANASYAGLMGLRASNEPIKKLRWPSRRSRNRGPVGLTMGVGEWRTGVHEGMPYTIRRIK
jgi:hypothetical protein